MLGLRGVLQRPRGRSDDQLSERKAIGPSLDVVCPTCGGPAIEQGYGFRVATLFSGVCANQAKMCGGWVDTMSSDERSKLVGV